MTTARPGTYLFRRACPGRYSQRGAALIEFAFVLPLLLALLVGAIYYGYVFVLETAVTHAAQQAVIAAVAVEPAGQTEESYRNLVAAAVTGAVDGSLDWLPSSIRDGVTRSFDLTPPALTVTVKLDVAGGSSPLLPQINIPGFGQFPPAPSQLQAVARVAL